MGQAVTFAIGVKSLTVVAAHPVLEPEPQIALPILQDGGYSVLRQTVVHRVDRKRTAIVAGEPLCPARIEERRAQPEHACSILQDGDDIIVCQTIHGRERREGLAIVSAYAPSP